MASVNIETLSTDCVPLFSTNVTASSITEPLPQTALPSTNTGSFTLGYGGSTAASAVLLFPYGVGSDTNTFVMNIYGWRRVPGNAPAVSDLWFPYLLATFTAITLDSALPGIAVTQLGTTQYFASAITLGVGNSGISVEVLSPGHAAHEMAHIVLSTKGPAFLQAVLSTGSSATSCNCLIGRM